MCVCSFPKTVMQSQRGWDDLATLFTILLQVYHVQLYIVLIMQVSLFQLDLPSLALIAF